MGNKKIVITNDDGIEAIGLKELVKNIAPLEEVYVVAPDRKLAGIGGGVTFDKPIKVTPTTLNLGEIKAFKISGTPSDCVILALDTLVNNVDIVLSGINDEPNVGDDIRFSGTLGACREAVFSGVPAIGISLEYGKDSNYFEGAVKISKELLKVFDNYKLPNGIFLNVNVPNIPTEEIRGIKFVKQGRRQYKKRTHQLSDSSGSEYYSIEGTLLEDKEINTENDALLNNFIAITPMSIDETDYSFLEVIKKWNLKLI